MDFLKRYRWKQCKLDSKRYYLEKCTIWKQSTYFELYSYFQILLVYICKLKDMLTNLNAGLHFLNSEIKMEKYSARLLSPSVVGDCFNMKWQPVEVALLIIPYIIYYIWNKWCFCKIGTPGKHHCCSPVDTCYVPCLSGNASVCAFRNYNLDRKLKTQIWSLWKHKIKTHK